MKVWAVPLVNSQLTVSQLHQMQSHLLEHLLHRTLLSCLDEVPQNNVSHGQSSSPFHSLHTKLRCTLKDPLKTTRRMEHLWLPQRSRQTYLRSWLKLYIHIQPIHPSAQISDVAEALVKKYPCLKEPGSFSGYYGWQQSIKYKMANYRTKLRGYGVPEVMCNALKRKSPADQKSAKSIKKPWKAEVNYLPPYPAGEDEESQEQERIQLLTEVRKRDNNKLIKEKMAKTCAHRRNKIIILSPSIEDIKARWPALFEASHVSYKCMLIRNIPSPLWRTALVVLHI